METVKQHADLEQQHRVANERLQQTNEELMMKQTQHDMEKKNLMDECEALKRTVTDTRKKVMDVKRDGQVICKMFEQDVVLTKSQYIV